MEPSDLAALFHRDLTRLKDELKAYPNEEDLWKLSPMISNSGGTLAIHIVGNLNHFLGAALGETGYQRDRQNEFSVRNVERDRIIRSVDDLTDVIEDIFSEMKKEDLENIYPMDTFGENTSYGKAFIILLTHLNYHLGQINYHRRILD